ncbi:FBP domain-containing protein [Actinocorallia aurantiaca]|uniref:FBP domain-containing protein n=1 Tax=Actinocorallia aurantiaca TaxID=46204 RepID=UPI0031CDBBEC
MRALTESEIRASFINCTKGEARRLPVPRDLAERPWDDLDFLGWRDLGAPERAYLVADHGGRLVGVALRLTATNRGMRRSMCSLCLTTHTGDGVALMTARRPRSDGDSVGGYFCTDLACSLHIRAHRNPSPDDHYKDPVTVEEKITRTTGKLKAFLDQLQP